MFTLTVLKSEILEDETRGDTLKKFYGNIMSEKLKVESKVRWRLSRINLCIHIHNMTHFI